MGQASERWDGGVHSTAQAWRRGREGRKDRKRGKDWEMCTATLVTQPVGFEQEADIK